MITFRPYFARRGSKTAFPGLNGHMAAEITEVVLPTDTFRYSLTTCIMTPAHGQPLPGSLPAHWFGSEMFDEHSDLRTTKLPCGSVVPAWAPAVPPAIISIISPISLACLEIPMGSPEPPGAVLRVADDTGGS